MLLASLLFTSGVIAMGLVVLAVLFICIVVLAVAVMESEQFLFWLLVLGVAITWLWG